MIGRSRVWLVVAGLYIIINFGGAVIALADGEMMHAGLHAALLLAGYPLWQLARRFFVDRAERRESEIIPAQPGELNDSLTHLEQSVDAVAIEVERIGEAQRFMTRFMTENRTPVAAGEESPEFPAGQKQRASSESR